MRSSSQFVTPLSASLEAAHSGPADDRWHRVKALFSAIWERLPNERAAYLDDACGGDSALRTELESLLDAASRDATSHFLEQPPAELRELASAKVTTAGLGARLAAALGSGYELHRELGGGGMSRVFLAREVALDRTVVIKVLNPETAYGPSAERFAREVRFAARLQQANIVPVHRVGSVGDLAYYIMPYGGESLRDRMSSGARPVSEALGIMRDIARALACAHNEGVVHRDIKPENVLISGGTAVVADFGIAKAISAARGEDVDLDLAVTAEGMSPGTPAYMAPEQAAADREVGPAADIYAFGVVAYEMLAGVHPFAGKRGAAALMAAHVLEQPRDVIEHRPDLPSELGALVMRCLEKDPGTRPADGRALLLALEGMTSPLGAAVRTTQSVMEMASVAILPLANLSPRPDTEFFSDGIAEELLNALTEIPGIRVAARTSSFMFRGQAADLRTIAQRLGVRTVLEGSVRRMESRVRISVRLIDAQNGASLWRAQYDRELRDIFGVQEEIAHAIAAALVEALVPGSNDGPLALPLPPVRRSRGVVNPDAFEHYLRGRHLVEQRSLGMHEALKCFEEAIRLDPHFSAPHAGIAMAHTLFAIYHASRPHEAFPRAREAADRALAIDPTDALALVMRAHVALWYEWDFHRAEVLAHRALELAPGLYLAHDCLGLVLAATARFDEAIAAMERARALDPLSENATYDLAWILLLAGRWEQAIRELEPAIARYPRTSELRRVLGFCLFYAGRRKEGLAELERVLELNVGDRWGSLNIVQVLAALGEVGEARRLVAEIEQRAESEPIPPLGIAIMHHALGDDDVALTWLERALESRDVWLIMLQFDPSMIRLRDHPRFVAVMERVRGPAA